MSCTVGDILHFGTGQPLAHTVVTPAVGPDVVEGQPILASKEDQLVAGKRDHPHHVDPVGQVPPGVVIEGETIEPITQIQLSLERSQLEPAAQADDRMLDRKSVG